MGCEKCLLSVNPKLKKYHICTHRVACKKCGELFSVYQLAWLHEEKCEKTRKFCSLPNLRK